MALKASPSSQHQHCTDEAQKAETVRASDVLVALFFQIEMPMEDEFPKSVVLHFPPSVYQRTGAKAMLPKLLQILNAEDLRCVQFLRGGKVRVSFREQADRDHFLSEGMRLDDEDIPVTRDAKKVTVLYVRDLPYEVASDDLVDFLSTFGEVLTVERSVAADTPNLCNGNRVLKMVLKDDLPYFISICGYQCRVWYRGQPIQCFVCRQLGHRAQSCPLSGRCRYCHQVGYMARNCAQVWDPTPPAVSHVIRTDVDESSVSDPGTIIADETSVPDSDPIPMTSEVSSKDNLPAAVPDPVVKVSSKPPDKSPADPVLKSSPWNLFLTLILLILLLLLRLLILFLLLILWIRLKLQTLLKLRPMCQCLLVHPSLLDPLLRLRYFVLASPRTLIILGFQTLVTLVIRNGTLELRPI